jgi:ABC-type uncharacterized transport system permease subunit
MKIFNNIKIINLIKKLFKYSIISFITLIIILIVSFQFKNEYGQAYPSLFLNKLIKKYQGVNNR